MDTKELRESTSFFSSESIFIEQEQEFGWPQFVPPCARQAAVRALLACSLSFNGSPLAMGNFHFDSHHALCYETNVPGSLEPIRDFLACDVAQMQLPSNIQDHLADFVHDAKFPEQWRVDNIESPSPDCYRSTLELLKQIYCRYGTLPSKVVATRSSTIYACYRNTRSGFTLRIEVDNDLDATAVVSNGSGQIEAGAFEDEFADRAVAILNGTART